MWGVEMVYPVLALVLLTFLVTFRMGYVRFRGARRGEVNPRYFKLLQGYELPDNLRQVERAYANLLEMPILFYLVAVLSMVLNLTGTTMVMLAWIYVGLRYVHSLIHLTYNKTVHRFLAFISSTLVLLIMWGVLFLSVI